MAFEMLIILFIIIAFLISFCNILAKLRHHYEQEASNNRRMNVASLTSFTEIGEGVNSASIFPDNTLPPPYTALDLPPKYEEVVDKRYYLPQVHKTPLENNQQTNQSAIFTIERIDEKI